MELCRLRALSLVESESVFKAAEVKGPVIFKGNEKTAGRQRHISVFFFSVALFGLDSVTP